MMDHVVQLITVIQTLGFNHPLHSSSAFFFSDFTYYKFILMFYSRSPSVYTFQWRYKEKIRCIRVNHSQRVLSIGNRIVLTDITYWLKTAIRFCLLWPTNNSNVKQTMKKCVCCREKAMLYEAFRLSFYSIIVFWKSNVIRIIHIPCSFSFRFFMVSANYNRYTMTTFTVCTS